MNPQLDYRHRLDAREATEAELDRTSARLSRLRVVLFLAILAATGLAIDHRIGWLWLLVPAAAFLVLVLLHDRVSKSRIRARRAADHYRWALARVRNEWAGLGEPGYFYVDPHHPYADHLDLFGTGSLFELLCTARTRPGRDTLARWLKEAAPPGEIAGRQEAVVELLPRVGLREELALMGEERAKALDPGRLTNWGGTGGPAPPVWLRAGLGLVSAAFLLALWGWVFGGWGPYPLLAMLAAEWGITASLRSRVDSVLESFEANGGQLQLLALILTRIEQMQPSSPRLRAIQARLPSAGRAPSALLSQLRVLGELLDSARNLLFAPIAAVLFWRTQVALAIDTWRAEHGDHIPAWLESIGEYEAFQSMAAYAYEHPTDPFPEVGGDGREDPGGSRALIEGELEAGYYAGEGMGHPLLPEADCVRNDVILDEALRLYVVSGSNMSGKSTLLRAVGLNAVMAQMGLPVRASRLRLSPLRVAASITVVDSLQDGISHFYAELLHLKEMLETAEGGAPVLFLLDEIFHGTNSHDRRLGAEALIGRLLERGALGLVTTHDLALSRVADALAPRAANVHFEDQLVDGRMDFDYTMRPGVVAKGNALALMAGLGLIGEDTV